MRFIDLEWIKKGLFTTFSYKGGNLDPVTIVEILGRAEQGMTLPFQCKDADGQLYYVKGRNADRRSLIAEWICGNLAKSFDLPVAPYAIVDIPELLIDLVEPEWTVLGAGLAFGSKALPHTLEVTWPQVAKVSKQLRRDILVFDWWIRNDDRNFTELGGNPNLLWDTKEEKLVVIDHNAAFSENFIAKQFIESHIFGAEWPEIVGDCVTRVEYVTKLQRAFDAFEQACDNCPHEWFWVGEGVPAKFDRDLVRQTLLQFNEQHFWEIAS